MPLTARHTNSKFDAGDDNYLARQFAPKVVLRLQHALFSWPLSRVTA
jgi:hypothetical protein